MEHNSILTLMKTSSFLKSTYSRLLTPFALALAAEISFSGNIAHAVTFNFNSSSETPEEFTNGFIAAGNIWSSLLVDNVEINIDIQSPSGVSYRSQTNSTIYDGSYDSIRSALSSDITSNDDFIAVSNLPSSSAFDMLINYTGDNPKGAGSSTPYLDNDGSTNNTRIFLTSANAKALGLTDGLSLLNAFNNSPEVDAAIAMNRDTNWDFDPSDGISEGAFDFVGVASHEIGHALGFLSKADVIDELSDSFPTEDEFRNIGALDLFRFSTDSFAFGEGVVDVTADKRDKYFSVDGGITPIADFSTGIFNGDGRQAQHWKDNDFTGNYLGVMDPTFVPGELQGLTDLDKQSFDVIGWDRADATPVPEPGAVVGLMAFGLGFLLKLKN